MTVTRAFPKAGRRPLSSAQGPTIAPGANAVNAMNGAAPLVEAAAERIARRSRVRLASLTAALANGRCALDFRHRSDRAVAMG